MRRLLIALAVTLLMAACGNGDTTAPEDDGATSPAPTAADIQPAATVQVGDTELGEVLVNEDGMTLYLFTKDTETTSACVDACVQNWPPLSVEGAPVGGDGVDESEFGSIARPDGTTQVTYAGHPLYMFAADQKAGDVNGQGVGDVWFAVTPEGDAAEAA